MLLTEKANEKKTNYNLTVKTKLFLESKDQSRLRY